MCCATRSRPTGNRTRWKRSRCSSRPTCRPMSIGSRSRWSARASRPRSRSPTARGGTAFSASLPFGGRLLSLRWILEAPVEMLDQASVLHRQDLLTRYPAYAKLAQQARAIRTALTPVAVGPARSGNGPAAEPPRLQQLVTLSATQEAALREMAVRREPAALVFPPLRRRKTSNGPCRRAMRCLIFFATSRQMYGFLLNNEKYSFVDRAECAEPRQTDAGAAARMGPGRAERRRDAQGTGRSEMEECRPRRCSTA